MAQGPLLPPLPRPEPLPSGTGQETRVFWHLNAGRRFGSLTTNGPRLRSTCEPVGSAGSLRRIALCRAGCVCRRLCSGTARQRPRSLASTDIQAGEKRSGPLHKRRSPPARQLSGRSGSFGANTIRRDNSPAPPGADVNKTSASTACHKATHRSGRFSSDRICNLPIRLPHICALYPAL